MSQDALDRTGGFQPFSKEKKKEFAIQKQEEETKAILEDPRKVKEISNKFRDHVERERKRLGLS